MALVEDFESECPDSCCPASVLHDDDDFSANAMCCTCGAGVAGACTVDAAMSIPRSPRFVEDKEIIPPRARWHGDLPSTLGHATLSRVKSSPSMRFGTSPRTLPGVVRGRTSAFVCSGHHGLFSPASCLCAPAERHRPTTANSSCHAYNVPLSTLSRVSSAKWGSRKDLRRVEVMKSKRDKDLAVGPYARNGLMKGPTLQPFSRFWLLNL